MQKCHYCISIINIYWIFYDDCVQKNTRWHSSVSLSRGDNECEGVSVAQKSCMSRKMVVPMPAPHLRTSDLVHSFVFIIRIIIFWIFLLLAPLSDCMLRGSGGKRPMIESIDQLIDSGSKCTVIACIPAFILDDLLVLIYLCIWCVFVCVNVVNLWSVRAFWDLCSFFVECKVFITTLGNKREPVAGPDEEWSSRRLHLRAEENVWK